MGEEAPLKTIGVIFKTIPLGYVSLKDSNITEPIDFVGKNIGLTPDAHAMHSAIVKKLGLDLGAMTVINATYDYTPLITGEYDVFTVYVTDETYHIVEEEGYELNVILPSDYGVSFYADSIFTSDETIENDPELVEKFLRATLKEWQHVIDHKDEAVEITLKYANDGTKSHEMHMLDNSIQLIQTGETPNGWMEKDEWVQAQDILLEQNIIEAKINIEDAYTMDFLEKIYG